jgi:CheY-like chemotaxis protein
MAYILMIDDNPQSQQYIERIIRHRSSHEIAFALTSEAAVDKMVERRPELIFLDLFIPGDGFVLFDNLRKHPATGNIPIVVHTAVPLDRITEMRLARMRTDGFIEFPIEASELNRLIDIALQRNSTTVRRWVPPSV